MFGCNKQKYECSPVSEKIYSNVANEARVIRGIIYLVVAFIILVVAS
jgi:hypothetical protein